MTRPWIVASLFAIGCTSSAPPATSPAEPPSTTSVASASEAPGPPMKFERGDRFGYRDATGKVVIEPRFLAADDFTAGGIAHVLDEKGWHVIDRTGRPILEPLLFDNGPDEPHEGLARFVARDKIGFYDDTGRVVIPAQYDFAWPFEGGRAAVCVGCTKKIVDEHLAVEGGQRGAIDRNGAWVEPLH